MADEPAKQTLKQKYVKPKSLAWWASIFPLFAGVVLAIGDAFQFAPLTNLVGSFFPGMSPSMLVNIGLVGVGLRGAQKD